MDVVVEVDRRVFAIEVKAATRWSEGDLSGLRAFLDRTPNWEVRLGAAFCS